jgi:hypothetical protein
LTISNSALPEGFEGLKPRSIGELLRRPGVEDIEFDPPKLGDDLWRPADFGLDGEIEAEP